LPHFRHEHSSVTRHENPLPLDEPFDTAPTAMPINEIQCSYQFAAKTALTKRERKDLR